MSMTKEQRAERVAWRTLAMGVSSIVPATTRAKAAYATFRSANEVGYKVTFPEIKARRAPEYDQWARNAAGRPWGEEWVKREMAAIAARAAQGTSDAGKGETV